MKLKKKEKHEGKRREGTVRPNSYKSVEMRVEYWVKLFHSRMRNESHTLQALLSFERIQGSFISPDIYLR